MTRARQTVLMLGAVLVTLALGLGLTVATVRLENQAVAMRFARLADLVSGRLQQRMNQHVALLRATRSQFDAELEPVAVPEFARYVAGLDLQGDYQGIQGIGFAALLPAAEAEQARDRIAAAHGHQIAARPPGDQTFVGPIVMLEPLDERNRHALGYDMFSESARREAMTAALETGEPRATGPVELVQEITDEKQTGFLIYIPTHASLFGRSEQRDGGFVYAPFRAGDLHAAVLATLPGLPMSLRTVDALAPDQPLFDNNPPKIPPHLAAQAITREIPIAGRRWQMTMTPPPGFSGWRDRSASLMVGVLSLLLVIAVGGATWSFMRALAEAERAAALSTREAEQRALLLREMQHRIKNHLARIQAIARQTMRSATDLAEFGRIFGARLSAMAKAQDAINRDGRDSADLRALLLAEIDGVVEADRAEAMLGGPPVRLNGREAQALGLVAYELSTNAMKYSADADALTIRIEWQVEQRGTADWLVLRWIEPEAQPGGTEGDAGGFGTQLIHALIGGDLNGAFSRDFGADGMVITIAFPLSLA
ncbi:CHASE domain-containing protein [Paracoccus niistensis]|uniref:histidine kinase n=1 Tax=Paracoccus niistensis TaxID=632935 RepID=A0ABV6I2V6_9RHOB